MTASSVPVDLLNPGQVFACIGLMELGERLCGAVTGTFDWEDPSASRFILESEDGGDPIAAGLEFLARAEVRAIAPDGSDLGTEKWGIPTVVDGGAAGTLPVPLPSSPASLPALLVDGNHSVMLASWADVTLRDQLGTRRDNVKFWAGAGGYPGAALLRDALDSVRSVIAESRGDPFSLASLQSSSFRFDWRRDYVSIDAGFSLNEHDHVKTEGYPLVEVLAAIGLAHARPLRVKKLRYRYFVVSGHDAGGSPPVLLPPPFLRAALGGAALPFPTRAFTMQLDWPGKENQARCITIVQEEESPS